MPEMFVIDAQLAQWEAQLPTLNPDARLQLTIDLAWHLRQRDTGRARSLVQAAGDMLASLPATERSLAAARLMLIEGEAKWLAGDIDGASAMADRACTVFDQHLDAAGSVDAHWLHAWIAIDRGNQAEGSKQLQAAAECARLGGDAVRGDLCDAATAVIAVYADHAAASAAWDARFSSAIAQDPAGDRALAGWIHDYQGSLAFQAGDFGGAVAPLMLAFDAAMATGQLRRAINLAANIGNAYSNLNAHQSALEWMERGLQIARGTQWPTSIGLGLMQTAQTLRQLGQRDAALAMLEQALLMLAPLPQSRNYAIALEYHGDLALDGGDYESALDSFRKLEERGAALGQTSFQSGAQRGQAHALSSLNLPEAALAKADAALALARDHGDTYNQIAALTVLALIHTRHELPAPEPMFGPNAALHFLRQAMAVAATIEGYVVPADLLDAVASEYAGVGDYARAYEVALRAGAARDAANAQQAASRAAAVQVQHQADIARAQASHQSAIANATVSQQPAIAHATVSQQPAVAHATVSRQPANAHETVSQEPAIAHATVSQQPAITHATVSQQPAIAHATVSQQPAMAHSPVPPQAGGAHAPASQQSDLAHSPASQQEGGYAPVSQQPDLEHAQVSGEPAIEHSQLVQQSDAAHAQAIAQPDIATSETVRAEVLKQTSTTLEHLLAIGQEITTHLEAAAIYRALDRHAHGLLDAAHLSIFVIEADGDSLTCAYGIDTGRALQGARLSLTDQAHAAARCVRERREVLVQGDAAEAPMRTQLFAPLLVGERVIGAMTVQSLAEHAYGKRERLIFRSLCAYGAIALDNANAYRQVAATLTKLSMTQAQLVEKNLELERAYQSLEDVSLTDQLTGLRNRRFFLQHVDGDVGMALRHYDDPLRASTDEQGGLGRDMVFFMVDLDHFKDVNDAHGHAAGDAVLVQMKERLREVFRESDYLIRWGGEEFLVLARATHRDDAKVVAERIRNAVARRPFTLPDGRELARTCSIGFACFPFVQEEPRLLSWSDVVELADQGLYIAKRSGRNAWAGIYATQETQFTNLFPRLLNGLDAMMTAGEARLVTNLMYAQVPGAAPKRAALAMG